MRYFVPATDDEIYAFIERYGIEALVPYRVGMPVALRDDSSPVPVAEAWQAEESTRQAA
jgi:hypothetical protein